jgi:hypothetical protein
MSMIVEAVDKAIELALKSDLTPVAIKLDLNYGHLFLQEIHEKARLVENPPTPRYKGLRVIIGHTLIIKNKTQENVLLSVFIFNDYGIHYIEEVTSAIEIPT